MTKVVHLHVPYKNVFGTWLTPQQSLCGGAFRVIEGERNDNPSAVTCKRCRLSLGWAAATDSCVNANAARGEYARYVELQRTAPILKADQ